MRRRGPARVAGRLARREISRHRGRSVLVVLLVAISAGLMCALATAWASAQSPETATRAAFGAAPQRLVALGHADGSCTQVNRAQASCVTAADAGTDFQPAALTDHVPGGHRGVIVGSTEQITLDWKQTSFPIKLTVADWRDPLTVGMFVGPTPPALTDDQVWATPTLLDRFGLAVGDTVNLQGRDYRIAAVVTPMAGDAYTSGIVVPAGHPLAAGASVTSVLLDGPELDEATVAQLNRLGIGVESRAAYKNVESSTTAATMLVVVACLITATMSSAAIAIGVRGSRRSLALLAASGADARMLGSVVLRYAWWLGSLGATVGAAIGIGLAWWHARLPGQLQWGTPNVPWATVAAIWAISVGSVVAAAWRPARQVARQDVLASVRNAELPAPAVRVPRLGLVLLAVGLVVAVATPVVTAVIAPELRTLRIEIAAGLTVATGVALFVGSLASLGWIIAQLGRLQRVGLAMRLAFRDAARHRPRAAAGASALLAVTALASMLLVLLTSTAASDARDYTPTVPPGWGVINVADPESGQPLDPATITHITDEVGQTLGPIRRTVTVTTWSVSGWNRQPGAGDISGSVEVISTDPMEVVMNTPVGIVDDAGIAALFPSLTADQLARLDAGAVLVSDPEWFTDIKTTTLTLVAEATGEPLNRVNLTPIAGPRTGLYGAWATPEGIAALGLPAATHDAHVLVQLAQTPTRQQVDQAGVAIKVATGVQYVFTAETGYNDVSRVTRLVVAWSGFGVLLAVSAVVTLLTITDAARTYATLADIGARPVTLRGIAAIQAWCTTAVGIVIGWLVGLVPMVSLLVASPGNLVPAVAWQWLLVYLLGVPTLAAGLAFVFLGRCRRQAD